jgi:hypothetical protein
MLLVFRQHRLASSATGGASVMLPACLRWLIKHCGAAIESMITKIGLVAHFYLAIAQAINKFQFIKPTSPSPLV